MSFPLTGWARRAARFTSRPTKKAYQAQLSVTALEQRDVPAVSVARVSDAYEGGAAGVFRFTRDGVLSQALTVTYSVSGTATPTPSPTADYTALSKTVTFAVNQATVDVPVAAVNDSAYDPDETVTVALDGTVDPVPVGTEMATMAGPTPVTTAATLTIIDNDPAPVVTVARVADGVEGGANGTFRFPRTGSTAAALTVSYTVPTVGPSMATPGSDYTTLSGTVTFAAGAATKDVTVVATNDTAAGPREEVYVVLSSGTGYAVGYPGSASLWITDNDSAGLPVVSVARVSDATEGGAAGVYRFTRTGSATAALTVGYAVDGPATAGVDYPTLPGSITFAAGSATKDLTLAATNDTVLEESEPLFLSVKTGTGYVPAGGNDAVLNILDDERGTIGGIVWRDGGDGIRQDVEGGAAGVPVALLDGTDRDTPFRETTTGTGGSYQFTGLPAGAYTVWFGAAVASNRGSVAMRNLGWYAGQGVLASQSDVERFREGYAVTPTTWPSDWWVGAGSDPIALSNGVKLGRGHVYAVVGILPDNSGVKVFDPFNSNTGGTLDILWTDLKKAFCAVDFELPPN